MTSEWGILIGRLKEKQSILPPGHNDILNIAGVIQAILSDPLGGNYGHAQYFLKNPDEGKEVFAEIRLSAAKLLGESDEQDLVLKS